MPWKDVTWVTSTEEAVPVEYPPDVRVEQVPAGQSLGALLLAGAVDAVALPHPPRAILEAGPGVRHLFTNPRAEEQAYFQRNGWWPIMHVVAFKEALLREHPWLPGAFLAAFERAKAICYGYYDDPNWSVLAWGRQAYEDQQRQLAPDPWPYGLARNRANLERFIAYSHEQGLIRSRPAPESLFAEPTPDS